MTCGEKPGKCGCGCGVRRNRNESRRITVTTGCRSSLASISTMPHRRVTITLHFSICRAREQYHDSRKSGVYPNPQIHPYKRAPASGIVSPGRVKCTGALAIAYPGQECNRIEQNNMLIAHIISLESHETFYVQRAVKAISNRNLTSAMRHPGCEYTAEGGIICHASHRPERLEFLASKLLNTDPLSSGRAHPGTSIASLRTTNLERARPTAPAVGSSVYRRILSPLVKGPPSFERSCETAPSFDPPARDATDVGIDDEFWTNCSQARGSGLNITSLLRAWLMPSAEKRARQRRFVHSARISLQSCLCWCRSQDAHR